MKITYFLLVCVIYLAIQTNNTVNAQAETDSVMMGAGYTNDIYYSFTNGTIHEVDRSNWDIGFYTSAWSAGIIVNDGKGIELYVYPQSNTSGWNSIDTAGMSTWPILYNSTDSWENGAFNRSSLGHPDYGWGVYNPITHDVVGDSLYLIKYPNGEIRKLWIERKKSILNTYYFMYADLVGTNEVADTVNCGLYTHKNFIYYSLENQEMIDREPDSDSWDVLYTRYIGLLPGNVPYPVVGVLSNIGIKANRFSQVDPEFEDYTAAPMDSSKSVIGYDWKYFDMNSFSFMVEDSLVFFLMDFNKDVYKLIYNSFTFQTGTAVFEKWLVHISDVHQTEADQYFSVFPNPSSDYLNVKSIRNHAGGQFYLSDIHGRIILQGDLSDERTQLDVRRIAKGLYFLSLKSGHERSVHKILIR